MSFRSDTSTFTKLVPSSGSSIGAFSASRPTRIVIHGWNNAATDMEFIKNGKQYEYQSFVDILSILILHYNTLY